MAQAQRIAGRGRPKPDAKNPSPAVSTVSPRKRASSCRIAALCSASSVGHARPDSCAVAVESTRSVKRTGRENAAPLHRSPLPGLDYEVGASTPRTSTSMFMRLSAS
jgi:hypothetical protein